jgi:hypothetical protein
VSRRGFWRRRPWQPARRCGWCGWYQPDGLDGRVYGRHDPAHVGHAPACAVRLFGGITTQAQLDDAWTALAAWAEAVAHAGEVVDWQRLWLAWSDALAGRATMIGARLPVEDAVPGDWR